VGALLGAVAIQALLRGPSYGVVGLPCRVGDPDRKGKVESGVGHAQKTPVNGELVTHAAIGVWYNPRQCRRHRYESKLINAEPLTGESGGWPPRPACVRWPL